MSAMKYVRYAARCLVRGSKGVMFGHEFQVPDWDVYHMDIARPFEALESIQKETRVVNDALLALRNHGLLPTTEYDHDRYLAMRQAVRENFDIPWTAISPRVQRLIYSINAIHQPAVMIAAGVFCGNTFFSNAGAAVGPGAVYGARALIGVEILHDEAQRAERNVRRIDTSGIARVVTADAVEFCSQWPGTIDLLYLDAEGDRGRGKGIYREILDEAWPKLSIGALILAHNSVNSASKMKDYLEFVRDPRNCETSINVVLDSEGLEVTKK